MQKNIRSLVKQYPPTPGLGIGIVSRITPLAESIKRVASILYWSQSNDTPFEKAKDKSLKELFINLTSSDPSNESTTTTLLIFCKSNS